MKKFVSENKWPLIIGGVAVLLRLVYLVELSRWPEFAVPMIDEKWHWEWAHEIIQSSFWGEQSWFRAPLYPYFLALLAAVTGSSIFWSKLLQTFLCVGTIFFTYRLEQYKLAMKKLLPEWLDAWYELKRKNDKDFQRGHGMPDLLRAWDWTLNLDHPPIEYEGGEQ